MSLQITTGITALFFAFIMTANCQVEKVNTALISGTKLKDSLPYFIQGTLKKGYGADIILDKLGMGPDITPLKATKVDRHEHFWFTGYSSQPELLQLRLPASVVHVIVFPGDSIQLTMSPL